jgi:hypothetical protein
MYLVSEDHSKRYRAIWGEMIEGYKCEASEGKECEGKKELQNLQSFINYDDTKASSRCRKDNALMF